MTEIWNLSTLCRCCHADGHFKSLHVAYEGKNDVEIYKNMLLDTFGVLISSPALNESYTICDECIDKLREAVDFKKQVLACEQKFQLYCNNEQFTVACDIKAEKDIELDDFYQDDDEKEKDEDFPLDFKTENQPEIEIKEKKEEKPLEKPKKTLSIPEQRKKQVLRDYSLIVKVETDTGTQFSCKNCGGLYGTRKEMTKHLNKIHPTLFKCEYCQKELKSVYTYKNHLKIHTGKTNQCTYCPKKFTSIQELKYHINFHTKEKIYKCDLCQKDLKNKQTLVKHLKIHAGTNKTILCHLCGGSFNDMSNLNAHTKSVHEKLRPFHCKICKKSFSAQRHLRDHLKLHNGERKIFTCDICDYKLTCPKTMEIHRLQHDGKFKCKFCSEIFDDAALKSEHLKLVHNKNVEWRPCPICGKLLAGKFSFNRHVDDHEGVKRFTCDVCCLKFSQKSILKRHILRKHDSKEDINDKILKTKCDICGISYKNIAVHKERHIIRPCVCKICGKTYPNNSALNRHKLEHFGKRFECNVCNKTFLRKDKLKSHRLKVHKIKIEEGSVEGS